MDGKDILHLQTRLVPGESARSETEGNGRGLWLLGCPVGSGWIKGARISG